MIALSAKGAIVPMSSANAHSAPFPTFNAGISR